MAIASSLVRFMITKHPLMNKNREAAPILNTLNKILVLELWNFVVV
jgi:hypothetical protein